MPRPEPLRRIPSRAAPLREEVRASAENRPGIYRFTGPRGELLYVGKSVRLRSRLLSYFREGGGTKAVEILRVAAGVEWEYIPTEFEALLREFRLIRAFRPRFNVQHRRDRRFAWIRVTDEPAPRLVATRRPAPGGRMTLGPFPAGRKLPETLRTLAHLVGIRDCPAPTPMYFADQLDLLAPDRAPLCPRADFGSCLAPCAGRCDTVGYQAGVEEAVAFLEGVSDAPLERLRERMERAAASREFELAARNRDRAEALEHLRAEILSFRDHLTRLTFVYRVPAEGGVAGYLIRGGRVLLTFREPIPPEMASRMANAMKGPELPGTHLTDGEREELFLVTRWFRLRPEELESTVPVPEYLDLVRDAGA